MKKWIKENRYDLLIMLIYMLVSFIILLFHEMWRDEAQAWLIARDLNLIEIISQMKYEGHFVLWYFILAPFAKLGFPYKTINIISWLIVLPAVWLILKKAPLKRWIKILFIFSYPMLYLYPSISRCYCLIPIAIVLIAITYQNRFKEPLKYIFSIVLLANTHIIMYGLVGALLLMFFIETISNWKNNSKLENKRIILSLVCAGILILLTILPLFTSLISNEVIKEKNTVEYSIIGVLRIFSWFSRLFLLNITIFIIVLIFLLIYELVNHLKNGIMIIIALVFQYFIYFFVYNVGSAQRVSTIILIVFLFVWIQTNESNKTKRIRVNYAKVILIGLLCLNVLYGTAKIIEEIIYNNSSAYEVAEFINEELPENSIIVSNNMPLTTSIIPYTEKNIKYWNPCIEEQFSYVTWNEDYTKSMNVDFKEKIDKNFDSDDNVYYIFSYQIPYDAGTEEYTRVDQAYKEGYLTTVFESSKSILSETYIIFKVNN